MKVSKPIKVSSHNQACDRTGNIKNEYVWKQEISIPDGKLKRVVTLQAATKDALDYKRESFLSGL